MGRRLSGIGEEEEQAERRISGKSVELCREDKSFF